MLSILIPSYETPCLALVDALRTQALALGVAFEIILADDASPSETIREENRRITQWPSCRYVQMPRNVGRAAIRNRLVQEARGNYLLFMDSDVEVCSSTFLADHWRLRDRADVICGAWEEPAEPAPRGHELRRAYEWSTALQKTAAWRNRHPYDSFFVYNALFTRTVFDSVSFDENCIEYGYEDALLGVMIERGGYRVLHTDNPLRHLGCDANEAYLSKTEAALRTLHRLGDPMQERASVSRFSRRFRLFRPLFALAFRLSRPLLRRQLMGRRPFLPFFSFYKLGYYSTLGIKA